MTTHHELSATEVEAFAAEAKVGLLATVNADGLPHVTLISTLRAKDPTTLTWGQFTEGESKTNVRRNPKVGWLVMTLDRKLWRGRALWTGARQDGEDFELYNQQPMFRYNAYFGVHTAHYMDLLDHGGQEGISVPRIAVGSILAMASRPFLRSGGGGRILKPWAEGLMGKLDAMKFLCYVGDDGHPVLVPMVPTVAADSRRLLWVPTVHRRALLDLREGTPVAVFAATMDLESVLVRGTFTGYRRRTGWRVGTLDVDYVYNTMPPKFGQVYPPVPLRSAFPPRPRAVASA
jgi:Pyridoxamine 5'-phosphate oxidase